MTHERSCGDNDPEPSSDVPRGDAAFGRKSWNPAQHTQLALWEAHNPLFRAANPALHLRILLHRAGDDEVNPGPVCSGCTGTIRVGSHPIICTQCQRLLYGYCNGLTRDQRRSPQVYVGGACGSTNGTTIQHSQITRSQPNYTFFCKTNIVVSNHPCSRLPQQISIPLQRRSTDHPNTEPTTPAEPPRATTVRNCPECKLCLAQVRSPLVCVSCRQQFHVKCARETQLALQRLRAADSWTCHLCASVQRAINQPTAVDRKTDCQSITNIASLFYYGTVIA